MNRGLGFCAAVLVSAVATEAVSGSGIRREANGPDGAPAFAILNTHGVVTRRVTCINNHYVVPDELAGRFVGSAAVLAKIVAKDGAIDQDDLGPATFDCIVVAAPDASCSALLKLQLPHARIDSALPITRGSDVTLWRGGQPVSAPSDFCRIQGTATPVAGSQIGFEIWMPSAAQWNGKFLQAGNGGFAGSVPLPSLFDGLKRGYATAGTDSGHVSDDGLDASWALGHKERVVDFGWRAVQRTTDAAKRTIATYYGRKETRAYFAGCSDGGRDAMIAAQRFPKEFDGIVSGAPAYHWTALMIEGAIVQRELAPPKSLLPASKLPALQAAALAACGGGSYVKDPLNCHFDPAGLACTGVETTQCLTNEQIAAVRSLYAGMRDPATGLQLPGLEPGSEAVPGGWEFSVLNSPTDPLGSKNPNHSFPESFFRYLVRENPAAALTELTPTDFVRARKLWSGALDATDPDLRAFKSRGGKLLQYQGWADALVPPRGTIAYHETVNQRMANTDDFYRLFMVPGMAHCAGGNGPWDVDWLAALERWVERGEAPQELIAKHPQSGESQVLTPFKGNAH